MNSIYCCAPCKPRYRRLVDNIYPRAINEGLINMQMQKLTFYAISHPEKLERIGEYLVQRMARDLARLRYVQVKIAVEAMDQLLEACHSSPSLVQFSESHLKMVQKLLESNIPAMEQLATASFVKFSNIEENSPSYHRQYDFFISKFSQMCHCSHGDQWRDMRCAGLRGLRGVVWKSVTEGLHPNIWERQHMDKIVPSILYNLQQVDDDVPGHASGIAVEGHQRRHSSRNIFSNGIEEEQRDIDDPASLSDQCLRELMGKATFGSLRAVLEPVLKHLDLHNKWLPPAAFAIQVFRAILYSIQTQNSYFVIQELINHLDTMSSSDAKVRIGIATVLSSIVSIAGTSIGPLLLSIFNSLLKHLRTSVEFQLSRRCPAIDDEQTYQETLINAMGDFANALPDYQKVEMMMFTIGNIPNLPLTSSSSLSAPFAAPALSLATPSPPAKGSDAILQHVLVKTLLKVATKYRTAYLATVFTDSFLNTLIRLALVPDAQVRITTLGIFHTLLDRHDNLANLASLGYELDVADLQLTVEKCSRADQMFMRKHVQDMTTMLYRSACLAPDSSETELREFLDAIQCIMSLLCVEVGYDEVLIELFRLSLALQDYALNAEEKMSDMKRIGIHNLLAKFLNMSSQLLALPALCQHVQQVVAARAKRGPDTLNLLPLDSSVKESAQQARDAEMEGTSEGEKSDVTDEEERQNKEEDEEVVPRCTIDELEGAGGLVFDGTVIAECLKASGKDVARLSAPLNYASLPIAGNSLISPIGHASQTTPDSFGTASSTPLHIDGSEPLVKSADPNQSGMDAESLDLSFDWSPPESPKRSSRRNTVFTLAPRPGAGLPISVNALRSHVNTPFDPIENDKKQMEVTAAVVEQLRSRPFEEMADEMSRHNEEGDVLRAVSRLLARNADTTRMSEIGRPGGARPKNIFDVQLPRDYVF